MTKLEEKLKDKDTTINVLTKMYEKERQISESLQEQVNLYKSLLKSYMKILGNIDAKEIENLLIQTGLAFAVKGEFLND